LAKYPQFKLVSVQDSSWDPVKAATQAKSLFAQYASKGGIQGVYAMNDSMAVGAIHAAQGSGLSPGLPKGMIIVGGACSSSGIRAMRQGTLYGDVTQSPKVEAAYAAAYVSGLISGKKYPKTVVNKEASFTRSNISGYVKQCTY
jgi:ABC-type sugar transport system substrate-binding protein